MDDLTDDSRLVRDLVEFCGLPPATIAKRAGVAPSTLSRPYKGTATTRLGRSVLAKLKAAFPSFPGWIEPADDYKPRIVYADESSQTHSEMVQVYQIDLSFGLGAAIMDTEIFEHQAAKLEFPRSWLRMITTSAPSLLCWARCKGNSMYPTIGDNDVVLIDRGQRSLLDSDLIWAGSYGSAGIVKRLRPMPDGGVKIMSDNPSVDPETAYDGELHIFGRVIAVIRTL